MYETHNIKQHRHLYELISEHSFFNYGKMNNGFGFFELVSNSDSRWPKQNARLYTFFRHACSFRKYTFILFLSKDYKRRKHNTCEILYTLPLIYSNTGEMLLPFLEGTMYMYLVHNHFHLNIPHLHIQYYLSSVSIRCRQSHTNVV